MKVIIYITKDLYAVEIFKGSDLLYREVCDLQRFKELMCSIDMPKDYYIKTSEINISEYMKIGKLRGMTPLKVDNIDNLNLLTHFVPKPTKKSSAFSLFFSASLIFLGVLIATIIMKPLVIDDMLLTREERIKSANAIITFNDLYGSNYIDGTWIFAELRTVYNPFRMELFHIDIDGTVDIIFLHENPGLNNMSMESFSNARLTRGASVTVDGDVYHIYRLGGKLNVN